MLRKARGVIIGTSHLDHADDERQPSLRLTASTCPEAVHESLSKAKRRQPKLTPLDFVARVPKL